MSDVHLHFGSNRAVAENFVKDSDSGPANDLAALPRAPKLRRVKLGKPEKDTQPVEVEGLDQGTPALPPPAKAGSVMSNPRKFEPQIRGLGSSNSQIE